MRTPRIDPQEWPTRMILSFRSRLRNDVRQLDAVLRHPLDRDGLWRRLSDSFRTFCRRRADPIGRR